MNLQPLDKTQWPYVGMIRSYFPGLGGQAAGGSGTLIHPQVILTAGHVVYDPSRGGYPTKADVYFAGELITPSPQVFRTAQPWVDTDSLTMNPISAYDVGAILLTSAIDPNKIPAVAVAVTPGANLGGLELNVVGFPVRQDLYGTLYGATAFPVDLSSALNAYRVFYPFAILAGMSGGPEYTRDSSGQILLRAISTSVYNGMGSGLRITQGIAALITEWLNEVGGA